MLIKKIIKFELRWPGAPSLTRSPITGYFQDKTKIFEANLLSGLLFTTYNLLHDAMYRTPPTWANSLTKFNPKMQNF